MKETIFDDLFISSEEYKLMQLDKQFIFSEKDMLWNLEKNKFEALDNYQMAKNDFDRYKEHLKSQTHGLKEKLE